MRSVAEIRVLGAVAVAVLQRRIQQIIEQLLADRDFNEQVKELIDEAGRK